jgi:hypothetical protein
MEVNRGMGDVAATIEISVMIEINVMIEIEMIEIETIEINATTEIRETIEINAMVARGAMLLHRAVIQDIVRTTAGADVTVGLRVLAPPRPVTVGRTGAGAVAEVEVGVGDHSAMPPGRGEGQDSFRGGAVHIARTVLDLTVVTATRAAVCRNKSRGPILQVSPVIPGDSGRHRRRRLPQPPHRLPRLTHHPTTNRSASGDVLASGTRRPARQPILRPPRAAPSRRTPTPSPPRRTSSVSGSKRTRA